MFSSIHKLSLIFIILGLVMFVGCSQEPDINSPSGQGTGFSGKDIPAGYYDSVDASTAASLRTSLHDAIDDHIKIPYTSTATDTWDVLETADEDPNDSGRILDVYMNESYPKYGEGNTDYNREHTWPSSYGFTNDGASNYPYTDCHHLFLCNDSYNSSRGNKSYSTVGGTGTTEKPTVANDGVGGGTGIYPGWSNWYDVTYWEVWWDRRGDIARAMFYMDVRYEGGTHGGSGYGEPDLILTDNLTLIENSNTGSNESVAYMGLLAELVQWHLDDPVDSKEIARNDAVFAQQGNRNPFIDHPEWVDCLFNDVCGGGDTTPPSAPTGLAASPGSGAVSLDWADNGEGDLAGYTVYRATSSGGPYTEVNGTLLTASLYTDSGLTGGTTYWYVVTASDGSGNESASSAEVSATPTGGGGPVVWINEFHYDNDSTDTGEFFEIAGTAGTDLSGWQVIGYNGNGGAVYDTENLSGTLPDQANGFGTLAFNMAGMQNGSPDGLALVDDVGSVLMFISYEGSFTATDGPAAGLTSTDIGVNEPTDSPVGWSLQLAGDGTSYGAFTWQSPAAATSGAVNTGQTFGAPVNQAPTAEANGPYAALAGAAVSFSSSGSTDSDGTIAAYLWDFGDGGSSTEANPSYAYSAAGVYTVTLTVTDDDGAEGTDTASADITVPNQAPSAEANGPYSGLTGTVVAFSSAGSTDTDGTIVSYLWDFGDGGSSTEVDPSYTYSAAGVYTVTLTVTDDDGVEGTDTASADITDPAGGDPQVWINEFHYDNDGGDKNEFVEVAGTAGTDLTGWTVAAYNGADGTVYMTGSFSGTLADQQAGFGTQDVAMVGIQNGSPDGLALVDGTGAVIQFLSYEGSFTATNGPAAGLTSTDIGISEPSTAPRRTSLQLAGTGSAYADFYWEGPLGKTDGDVNANQTFTGSGGGDTTPPAAPGGLSATAGDGTVAVNWSDNGESDLDGYTVYRATSSGGPYTALNGSLLSASTYDDNSVNNGTTYYYVVTATDLTGNESADSSEVDATPQAAGGTTAMHVDAITLSTTVVRNKEYGHAAVLVVDDQGNPVPGATVAGTFSGSIPGADSAVTGSDGIANLTSPKAAKPGISFTFCVDNITLAGYSYDSGANVQTCDSY